MLFLFILCVISHVKIISIIEEVMMGYKPAWLSCNGC